MADDKNKDLDPEEENNDAFEDDDFGLPDLEYDELDDDEFDDEFDTPEFDDSSEPQSEEDASGDAAAAELEEAFRVEDAFGDLEEEVADDFADEIEEEFADDIEEESSDDLEGEYEVDDLDDLDAELDSNQFEISDDELQKELEELESGDLDFSDIDDLDESESSEDEFYEQESFEEFSEENPIDSVFGDDDVDEAVKEEQVLVSGSGPQRDMTAKQKAANHYSQAYAESQGSKGKFARIVIIGTIVILVVASALWLAYDGSGGEKEIARKEQPKAAPVKKEPKQVERPQQETAKPEPKPATKPAATPSQVAAGTVIQLESRTGKAYVIIASFVDGDLALDHANKLASDGNSPYVIPPFNNGLYYRVAIAEFQTFADATQNISRYKEEFGQDIWTLRY